MWERNVTGRGVTVVVVDDGVEHTIKDIQPNYVSAGSAEGWGEGRMDSRRLGTGTWLTRASSVPQLSRAWPVVLSQAWPGALHLSCRVTSTCIPVLPW